MSKINMSDLAAMAKAAGWTVTARRGGRTYYRTPAGARAWIEEAKCSVGFWVLANA